MKKLILSFVFILLTLILSGCNTVNAVNNERTESLQEQKEPAQTVNNSQNADLQANQTNQINFAVETDNVWAPTFQLCWNEFIKHVGTPTIQYVEENPPLADELNKQKFTKEDLNEKDYYISVGKATVNHKKQIEKAIWNKFQEKSDILDKIEFQNVPDDKTSNFFIYSMLIKKFKFIAPFDVQNPRYFNNDNSQKYKFFGIDYNSRNENLREIYSNLDYLFYASEEDFAVKIYDKNRQEEVILYLTESNDSFDDLYNEVLEKCKHKNEYTEKRINELKGKNEKYADAHVSIKDTLSIPFMTIDKTLNFNKELANKIIKGKNFETNPKDIYVINKTIQTIKFKMDNEGVKLKSEAGIMGREGASARIINLYNKYIFNRPFVIFLKEADKEKPYFAARIKDGEYLVKD